MVTVFNSKGTTWWLASKVKAKQTPIYMDQVMDQTIPSRALAANLLVNCSLLQLEFGRSQG
jgi:hypothetical protein